MKKHLPFWIALAAVLLGFVVGAVVLLCTQRSPLDMGYALIQSVTGKNLASGTFNPRYIGEFLVQSMPIVLTGLSVGFAFRTGLFNLGAEGQLMMGSVAATAVALFVPAPPVVHVVLVVLAAMAAGALWGMVAGFLKARFNVHEVVATIMLNYMALYVGNGLVLHVFKTQDAIKTVAFPASALLKSPWLTELTNGSRLNWGVPLMVLALLIYGFVINKTPFGYGLRAVGFSQDGARYAGIPVKQNLLASMAIAGAFAGLAGAIITTGTFGFGRVIWTMEGYGFDGIAVALVGGSTALGILLSGLLFGMLKSAQPLMQSQGIPKEIASIVQACIVLFIAMKYGLQRWLGRRDKPSPVAPQPVASPSDGGAQP